MKEVVLIIPHLGDGGAERFFSILANYIDKEKYSVTLVLVNGMEGHYLKNIVKAVKVETLNAKRLRYSIFKIWSYLNKKKPDVVLSTIGSLNILMCLIIPFLPKSIKFIAREANMISMLPSTKFERMIYKLRFNIFDKVIAQSNDMKNDLLKNTNIKLENIVVINNAVDNKLMDIIEDRNSKKDEEKIKLISIGRLTYQKGQEMLIDIFNEIQKNEKVELNILGNGPDEESLKKKVKELGLEQKIRFLGFQKDPYKYLKSSDIFLLTSRFEGFPNVLLEANYCGVPVISFKCKGGIDEIIFPGINGEIAECFNLKEYEEKLKYMIRNISQYKKNEIKNITEKRYSTKVVVKKYENLF